MPSDSIVIASEAGSIGSYESRPDGKARGGLVLLQELFGLNQHIRRVADGYAADGYHVIAPALFDRAERNVQLGYGADDIDRARKLRATVSWEQAVADVEAARRLFDPGLRVATLGFCWGGAIAWLAACRMPGLSASVSYYGGGIGGLLDEIPRCPVLCHFGETDQVIPLADVERLKQRHPQAVEVHVYPAGHGFNCDERSSHHPQSAVLARERTLAFLRNNVG
jgi:carboxymethylenebutenolidase